jgi:hypothetical protein
MISPSLLKHFEAIGNIVKEIGEPIEGNFVCDQYTDPLTFQLEKNKEKIENIQNFSIGKKKICEIGINACHSLLITLEMAPNAEYHLFDINWHKYTEPCLEYVKSQYPKTKFYTYYGDSKITLLDYVISKPLYTFDFCHIDGGHEMREVCNDFTYVRYLMKPGSPVMFDDYNLGWIRDFIQKRVEHNEIKLLPIQATELHTVYHYLSIC